MVQNLFQKPLTSFLVFALPLTFTSGIAQAAVWKAKNHWSTETEDQYSDWVMANWDENFFSKPGTPFAGLYLDCADTVYAMRIVYSYLHSLPFAMKDPSGGKKLISNEMTRFDTLPEDGRIRSFLNYVFNIGSTQTLADDTYSVPINRHAVRSGSLIRSDQASHHSWTIKQILPTGIPHLVFSSRPAKNTLLVRIGQPSMEFTFKGKLSPSQHAGFRNFRRIGDLLKPEWESQGYSAEQFYLPYKNWLEIVKKKLSIIEETHEALLRRELDTACSGAKERVESVNEGLAFLLKNGQKCFNSTEFDDYSTPNQDLRLRNSFEELRDSFHRIEKSSTELALLSPETLEQVEDVLTNSGNSVGSKSFCPIAIAPGRTLSLSEIRRRSLEGLLSSNPHDPIDFRWGARSGTSALAKRCPKFEE